MLAGLRLEQQSDWTRARQGAKVASSIEGGKTFTADQLKDRFARAHHALAVHHHQVAENARSENARSENRLGNASKALKAAAVNLKHGVSWTGENLIVKPGAKIVDSSIKVTGGLIDGTLGGTGKGVKAIGNGIGLLGDKIKRVGKVPKTPRDARARLKVVRDRLGKRQTLATRKTKIRKELTKLGRRFEKFY